MAPAQFTDIRTIRKRLGKSQSEFARLLGRSVRAVQSYEQGWRVVPRHVQQTAALLLYLHERKTTRKTRPCWEIRRCKPSVRQSCPVHEFDAGDLCWFLSAPCREAGGDTDPLPCAGCEVMKTRLRFPD